MEGEIEKIHCWEVRVIVRCHQMDTEDHVASWRRTLMNIQRLMGLIIKTDYMSSCVISMRPPINSSYQISYHVHSTIPEIKCVVKNIYIAFCR